MTSTFFVGGSRNKVGDRQKIETRDIVGRDSNLFLLVWASPHGGVLVDDGQAFEHGRRLDVVNVVGRTLALGRERRGDGGAHDGEAEVKGGRRQRASVVAAVVVDVDELLGRWWLRDGHLVQLEQVVG